MGLASSFHPGQGSGSRGWPRGEGGVGQARLKGQGGEGIWEPRRVQGEAR